MFEQAFGIHASGGPNSANKAGNRFAEVGK
jgi:hypothetical protein